MQDFKAKTLCKISCQPLTPSLDVENYELPTGYKNQVILDTTKYFSQSQLYTVTATYCCKHLSTTVLQFSECAFPCKRHEMSLSTLMQTISLASFSNDVLALIHSYDNKLSFTGKLNLFLYDWLCCTRPWADNQNCSHKKINHLMA